MRNRHKHADIIIAWAEGREVEIWHNSIKEWVPITFTPCWTETDVYRIKPEPKPVIIKTLYLYVDEITGAVSHGNMSRPNIKLTFNPEDGTLKKAEMIL